MNPFIKGKLDKVVLTGITIVILVSGLSSYYFYQQQVEQVLQQALQKELKQAQDLDSRFGALKAQIENTAHVIVSELAYHSQGTMEVQKSNQDQELLSAKGYSVKHYSLLSTENYKRQVYHAADNHYVFNEPSIYLNAFDILKLHELVNNVALVASVGESKFQSLLERNVDLSASLMEWLHANEQLLTNKNAIERVVYVPPMLTKKGYENFLILSLPTTNLKPAYIIVNLNSAAKAIELDSSVRFALWQTSNKRVVSSNIDVGQMASSNIQSYMITRFVPGDWHDAIFEEHQQSRFLNHANNEYIARSVKFTHVDYSLLLYQSAETQRAWLLHNLIANLVKMIAIGTVSLTLLYFLVFRLFARPISSFLNFVEKQSSLYQEPDKKIPNGWDKWFQQVAVSYDDNRKLFNSLVAKNKQLDEKIKERTRELQLQTISKDRNLALNRAIINSMPDMIYYKNVDGSFVGCNKAFEKLCGLAETDLVTQTAEDLFDKDTAERLSHFDLQALRSRRLFSAKLWQKLDNDDIYVNWLVAPIINSEGEVLGTVGLGRDITEQEANFRQIEQARAAAEQADQAKSEFIANMSHEIRTPMNAVLGMIELLNSASPTALQTTYLGLAESSSRHLLQVINDILDFSRINAGIVELSEEEVDFAEVLDISFANSLASAMEKKLILDIDLPLDFPMVMFTDKIRLSQIFTNLISNAVKFTKEGRVTVSGRVMAGLAEDAMISFKVSDTGIGIPQSRQQVIFDAFSQADSSITRQYGGTGLGLAIVFQLVDAMGGEIRVESTEGEGTSFEVILPLKIKQKSIVSTQPEIKKWLVYAEDERLKNFLLEKLAGISGDVMLLENALVEDHSQVLLCQPSLLESLPVNWSDAIKSGQVIYQPIIFDLTNFSKNMLEDISYRPILSMPFSTTDLITNYSVELTHQSKDQFCSGCNILIVEDNNVNQQVIALMLESFGANYAIAENGLEGLRLLNKSAFDAVLLDIQMPVMDGLTFAAKVREQSQYKSLPLIAMSAHTRAEDKRRSLKAGVSVHLSKPIDKQTLVNTLRSFLKDKATDTNSRDKRYLLEPSEKIEQDNSNTPVSVIDVENLLEQVGGNHSLMGKLLSLFLDSKITELKGLVSLIDSANEKDLYATLHNFEGMLANIRANKAVEAIKNLRKALKSNEPEVLSSAIEDWQASLEDLIDAIQTYLPNKASQLNKAQSQ